MSPRDYISLKVVGRSALYFLSGIFLSDRLCVPLHFCSLEQSKTVICCLTTLFLFTFYCQSLDCNIEGYYEPLRRLASRITLQRYAFPRFHSNVSIRYVRCEDILPHFVAVRPEVVLSEAVADGLPQSLQFPLVTATIGYQFDHSAAHLLPFEFVM